MSVPALRILHDTAHTPAQAVELAHLATLADDGIRDITALLGPDAFHGRPAIEVGLLHGRPSSAEWGRSQLLASPIAAQSHLVAPTRSPGVVRHELGHATTLKARFDDDYGPTGMTRAQTELAADLAWLGTADARQGWRMYADALPKGPRELGMSPWPHADQLPHGAEISHTMASWPYEMAMFLGGPARDAVEGGLQRSDVAATFIHSVRDITRNGSRDVSIVNGTRELRAETICRSGEGPGGRSAAVAMSDAWDGRGLTADFLSSWRGPDWSAYV